MRPVAGLVSFNDRPEGFDSLGVFPGLAKFLGLLEGQLGRVGFITFLEILLLLPELPGLSSH